LLGVRGCGGKDEDERGKQAQGKSDLRLNFCLETISLDDCLVLELQYCRPAATGEWLEPQVVLYLHR
jgi:hypothetical protein